MKKTKLNKNVLALILSILLALICAFLLKTIVDRKIESSISTDTVSYVVANGDLNRGAIIDPFNSAQFAVRSDIPAEFAQSTAITPAQAKNVEGALLLVDLRRGDILTWQAIDTDERRQLASRLLPGRRALTIPVDDQSSISSMLNPDDHIDLILTYQKNGNIIAAPLLQNVKVLATGDSLSVDPNYSNDSNYNNSFRTITLDLDLDDVSKITTALELGRLSAVLRNPDDLTFTSNVVSLATLQQELSLKTFEQLEAKSQDYKSYMDDNYIEEYAPPAVIQEYDEPPINKPSIDVVYGNRPSGK